MHIFDPVSDGFSDMILSIGVRIEPFVYLAHSLVQPDQLACHCRVPLRDGIDDFVEDCVERCESQYMYMPSKPP